MEPYFEHIDHTGDIGMDVWGFSREELLVNASKALTEQMVDIHTIALKKEEEWIIDASSPEELMVKQLQEILFRFDSEGMVFGEFNISLRGLNSILCIATGEPLNREKHHFKSEIKAVTYHQMGIVHHEDKWIARIIFDI